MNSKFKVTGKSVEYEVHSLNDAMFLAKKMNEFVTISGPEFEIVGKFGVDSVENGVTPDGVQYDWNKASRIGRVKKERT